MPTRGGVLRLEPRRDGPAELIARSVLLEFSAAFIARYARRCRELSQRLWRSFRNASARFPRRSLRNLRRPNREDSKQRSSRSLRCVHREVSAAFIAKSPQPSSHCCGVPRRVEAGLFAATVQNCRELQWSRAGRADPSRGLHSRRSPRPRCWSGSFSRSHYDRPSDSNCVCTAQHSGASGAGWCSTWNVVTRGPSAPTQQRTHAADSRSGLTQRKNSSTFRSYSPPA